MELDGDEEQSVQEAYTPDSQCFGCGARAGYLSLALLPQLALQPVTPCFGCDTPPVVRGGSRLRCRWPAAPALLENLLQRA